MVTGNDYVNDLFNGDIGYLRAINDDGSFDFELDGGLRKLPPEASAGFDLAYAMTTHRAQGSEFPVVIMPMHTSAFILLERRLFYTAVSRARRTLIVVGQPAAISIAIGRHEPHARRTTLRVALSAPVDAIGLPASEDELARVNALSGSLPDPDFDF